MITAIRKSARNFTAVIVLALIAAAVAYYVLGEQRFRFPWEGKPFSLNAAFSTAQAVTPGQGQTIRVSGVRVGDISQVSLKDGEAIVKMDLDPQFKDLVHTDARALLRPKTGLKDMFIELSPGTRKAPLAKEGWTLPISNTLPDVNPDEIFSALDGDTRDYLALLVNGAGGGLAKRGSSLKDVFRRFEPTHRDLALVTGEVAKRRSNLRRLITSLKDLNGELASKGDDLAQLVDSSSAVFRAFASEQANVSQTVRDLPATLRQTTQTLGKVQTLANVLGPTVEKLRPAARALDPANKAVRPFAIETAPILRDKIRPFVRTSRPLVRALKPASQDLAKSTPDLTATFVVLNHLFNLLGYNARGREDPSNAQRDEGYLFWIAWLQHNGAAVFSSSDANGPLRPVTVAGACTTLTQLGDQNPALGLVLAPALLDKTVCK